MTLLRKSNWSSGSRGIVRLVLKIQAQHLQARWATVYPTFQPLGVLSCAFESVVKFSCVIVQEIIKRQGK